VSNSGFTSISQEASSPAYYAERANLPPQPKGYSLWQSVCIQKRVISALILREILTRFGRRNLGFLWLFVEPALFIVVLAAIWHGMNGPQKSGVLVEAFVLTGYSTVLLWRNMPGRCIKAMAPNVALLYHRQVKPIDIYFARAALEAAAATMSFVALAIAFIGLGLSPIPDDILKVLAGWGLLIWYGLAMALFFGATSERGELIEKIWSPLTIVMLFLSGTFFMLESFPPAARDFLLYIPTVSCIELLREGYFGPAHKFHYNIPYVITFNAVLMLLGLAQVRYISRHISFV
jgi:ABC-2 type transport system permease protein/capsular polysaccharide transport system permease protein